MILHLPDRLIIAFARDDGPRWVRRHIVAHLQRCPPCRGRLARLGDVRDVIREATDVSAPDRFQDVLARLDEGDVVILPTAQPTRARPLLSRKIAVIVAALAVSAAGAFAAVKVLGPDSPTEIDAPISAPAVRSPAAGLAVPLSTDSFVVRIATPRSPTTVRVGLTSGDAVEVTGSDAASRSRFEATGEGIHVSETPGGELRVSVPVSARRVLVRHGDTLLLEVAEGRFLVHSHARFQGDSAVFLDVGSAEGPDTIAPGAPS